MTQLKSFFDIVNELSMKSDKKLPNLKVPVKGKRGVSKFMRKKVITKAKDDLNAGFKTDANRKAAFAKMNDSVQSADRKPEKYMKPDGKVGIRMVKTDKEIVKKEVSEQKIGGYNVDNDIVIRRGKKYHKTIDNIFDRKSDAEAFAKKYDGFIIPQSRGRFLVGLNKVTESIESVEEAVKNLSAADQVKAAIKIIRDKRFNMKSQIDKKTAIQKISKDLLKDPKVKKEMDKIYEESKVDEGLTPDQMMRMHQQAAASQKKNQQKRDEKEKKSMAAKAAVDMKARNEETEDDVDEALTLQQRMKRSRMMRRMRTRIKVGRERAKRKMANKEKLEKRARRQARNMLAKKLTRGIPKAELTFARKKEIEKRLEKPVLQARIKRIAKRIFKDVRKKEVQRKKG